MNPYDNAVISVKKYESKGERIYGELRSSEGELLVSASLEHITQVLEQRMTKFEDKNRMQFENAIDEELIELYHKQAHSMSYYNAAEGQSWYAEASAREACSAEFRKINEELKRRDIPTPQGDYLV